MELLTQAITQLQVEYMFETEMFAVIKNVASVWLTVSVAEQNKPQQRALCLTMSTKEHDNKFLITSSSPFCCL